MDTATIEGRVYIKATKAAKEAGYTSDYVGQLCRKGAIDAEMLGKTWFVQEDALADHKRNKSRSNKQITRREFKKQKTGYYVERPTVGIPTYHESIFKTPIRYFSDEEDDETPGGVAISTIEEKESGIEEGSLNTEANIPGTDEAEEFQEDVAEITIRKIEETEGRKDIEENLAIPQQTVRHNLSQSERKEAVKRLLEKQKGGSQRRLLSRRISYVPALLLVSAFLLSVSNLFVYSTWQYDTLGDVATTGTVYNFAALHEVADRLKIIEF